MRAMMADSLLASRSPSVGIRTSSYLGNWATYCDISLVLLAVWLTLLVTPVQAETVRVAPTIYETNRHLGQGQFDNWGLSWMLGPYTNPETACRTEVFSPNRPDENYRGYDPASTAGDFNCRCFSNPEGICGFALLRCPVGYKGVGCHRDEGFPYEICDSDQGSCWLPEGERNPIKSLGQQSQIVCEPTSGGSVAAALTRNFYYPESAVLVPEVNGLQLGYTYNSGAMVGSGQLGRYWRLALDRRLTIHDGLASVGGTSSVSVSRPDGKILYFTWDGVQWRSDDDVRATLARLGPADPVPDGWQLRAPDNAIELYTESGRLTSITSPGGQVITVHYGDPESEFAGMVTDERGASLKLACENGKLKSVSDDSGRTWSYSYDQSDNLVNVQAPDGTVRRYLYESTYGSHLLTGVIDERGVRSLTVTYDAQSNVTSREGALGTGYASYGDGSTAGIRTIANGKGYSTDVSETVLNGVPMPVQIAGPSCSAC